jgi:hypothetical protein
MNDWSLSQLLSDLHSDIEQRLSIARKSFSHPGTKGNASEHVWLELFQRYLPERYQAATAHVVDSQGKFSDQIDVVIFDRQYSPFIFKFEGQLIVPAESVYGVFEAKQSINSGQISYAQEKAQSVRRLNRTSLPIPHAGGMFPPKALPYILAGLLAFERRLDIGCVAAHGIFECDEAGCHHLKQQGKPATAFLFELIARLQTSGTVPMIDIRAYAKWLAS